MRRKLNIDFVGFGAATPMEDRFVYRLIDRNYEICREGKPDYVVVQGASAWDHSRYDDCVKILLNGENDVPDFNAFDYAIGFDPKKYERELESFLVRIFEQPLEQARRRCFHGHQQMMREHMRN